MQNATIDGQQEPLIKERFPSVVDTDDMIFEMGKQKVKVLNLEKLLNKLLEKTKVTEQIAQDFSKAKTDSTEKLSVLQDSNKRYEENNRKLDAEIVRLRNENATMKTMYEAKIGELTTRLENTVKPKIIKKKG